MALNTTQLQTKAIELLEGFYIAKENPSNDVMVCDSCIRAITTTLNNKMVSSTELTDLLHAAEDLLEHLC